MPKAQDLLRRIGEQPHVARLVARMLRRGAYDLDRAHYCRVRAVRLRQACRRGGGGRHARVRRVAAGVAAHARQPRRSHRAQVVRGDDARFHGARQHRGSDRHGADDCRFPRHDPQGVRCAFRAGIGDRWRAHQPDNEVGLCAAEARAGAARRGGLHRELSIRPLHDGGRRLPDAGRTAGAHAGRPGRESLHSRRCRYA